MSPLLLAAGRQSDTDRQSYSRRVGQSSAGRAIADKLADSLAKGGTAVVLDLEAVLGVHVAAHLNREGLAHAVIVIPSWPYDEAVLPTDEVVDALISQSRRLTAAPDLPNVAFVLDAQRNQSVPHRASGDRRADNRYRLSTVDLPNLARLRAAGIRRVLKLAHP